MEAAARRAKVSGYTGLGPGATTSIALDELNRCLAHICRTVDLSAARGQWNFTFNSALATSGGGNIVTSGPNPLPMDYLRVGVSGGSTGAQRSSKWYLQGVPYDMVELDLSEFDDQVQQAGMQSYPYFWAKDMAQRAVQVEAIGDITTGSTTVSNIQQILTSAGYTPSVAGIKAGMSICGGIGPLVTIAPGTTILTVNPTSLVLSQVPALQSSGQAAITQTGASLTIGYPGAGYAYPPPSGAYNAMIRYQRLMPYMTQAQIDAGAYCWFDDDTTLIDMLATALMGYSDDEREMSWEQKAEKALGKYLKLADDNANRATMVSFDRRYFGSNYNKLRNSKQVGW